MGADLTAQDLITIAIIAVTAYSGNPGTAAWMAAAFVAGKLLAPDPSSVVSNAKGRNTNVRSSIETRKLV